MKPYEITLLPAQLRRLASVAEAGRGALGLSQDGSTITVHTGARIFQIDAEGKNIEPPNQERLPC